MKDLHTLLQNACEDYLTALNRPILLTDIEYICSTNLADIVWKALQGVPTPNLKTSKPSQKAEPERVINGVKQSDARRFLTFAAQSILNKPIGDYIGTLKMLFRDSNTYGFNFLYGTREGLFETLKHDQNDSDIIIGYGFDLQK